MAKKVEKWVALDGKEFDRFEDAEEHELFCEIWNMLRTAFEEDVLNVKAVQNVVEWVKQDRENLREFLSED